jgi:hypothetical protein
LFFLKSFFASNVKRSKQPTVLTLQYDQQPTKLQSIIYNLHSFVITIVLFIFQTSKRSKTFKKNKKIKKIKLQNIKKIENTMTKDRSENTDIKTGETTPSVVRNPTNVKLEDGENDNQTAENQCLITADATPNELPSPSSSSSIPSASSSQNNSDTSRVTANKTESCPSQLDDDEDDADSKIKFEEEKFDCLPIPFDAPIPYNLSSNNDSNPTTRLSFEDDPARGSDSATLNYQENEDVGSPPPIGADGAFPTSCFEDMSIFPSFPNQYHIDDAYSTNLLGCTFLPSPNDSGNAMPSIAPQFHLNFHDIRAQYRGPTLSSSACNNINGHAFPNNPPPPPPFIRSLHSTDEDDDEEEGRIRRSSMGSSGGKSLDNLSQISARASRTNRSRRPRQTSRNLPLRKRHTSIDHNRDQQLMTTPLATTRSSRRMVSRSASAEKKKGRGMSSSMQIDTHRNWSKRHGSSTGNSARANSTKSFTRTSATSAARFNNVPTPTLSSASKITPRVRVIEHFTPKRNTKAILSKESALPNTVIIG